MLSTYLPYVECLHFCNFWLLGTVLSPSLAKLLDKIKNKIPSNLILKKQNGYRADVIFQMENETSFVCQHMKSLK